jgi:hypothetical protein
MLSRNLRGATLATTLMVISLVLVTGLSLVGVCMSQLASESRTENLQIARNLAESALAQGIRQLCSDNGFGLKGETLPAVSFPGTPGARGLVTFDRSQVYSTNNLGGTSSVVGYTGRQVPKESAHLVGTGLYRDCRVNVEAILRIPRFPYCIASSGPFVSKRGVLVAAVKDLKDLTAGDLSRHLEPGSMASNSDEKAAVKLNSTSVVTGDVQAVGNTDIDPLAEVRGKIRVGADPADIPEVPLTDPTLSKSADEVQKLGPIISSPIEGFNRRIGPLQVSGDLKLNDAILRVDGDLTVDKAIRGRGAIFCSGNLTVKGGANVFTTDQQVAIVAKGDVDIRGDGKSNSVFAGMIYTEGNFKAEDISLFGAFIANGKQTAQVQQTVTPPRGDPGQPPPPAVTVTKTVTIGSAMTMNNVQLVKVDQYQKIKLELPPTLQPPSGLVAPNVGGYWGNYNSHTNNNAAGSQALSMLLNASFDPFKFFDAKNQRFRAEDLQLSDLTFQNYTQKIQTFRGNGMWDFSESYRNFPNREAAVAALGESLISGTENILLNSARDSMNKANVSYAQFVVKQQAKIKAGLHDTFELDINKFLKNSDTMRVLLWRPM